MYTVYILRNTLTNRHYIGSTNDFERRLFEHNRGQTKSTRLKGSWKLVYRELYSKSLEAKEESYR